MMEGRILPLLIALHMVWKICPLDQTEGHPLPSEQIAIVVAMSVDKEGKKNDRNEGRKKERKDGKKGWKERMDSRDGKKGRRMEGKMDGKKEGKYSFFSPIKSNSDTRMGSSKEKCLSSHRRTDSETDRQTVRQTGRQ